MGWPPSLRLIQLLAFKSHRPSILHYDSSYGKVERIGMDFKILVKIGQLQHGRFHQNAFQGFKGLMACLLPFLSHG